ncbi:MAG: chemotaxis protein CheR [Spirochaetaceae bacterium]|jgi:chemotaxis protein methyltransferase CheR|nr:chemotaxis protein CheR [Spirochaetaceae bacterium]
MNTLFDDSPDQKPVDITRSPVLTETLKPTDITGGSLVIENLYRRVEQTLGIKAAEDALKKLREHLEQQYGRGCFESPNFYDRILSFPEDIFTAARFLTINETYFFREEGYFDLFRKELLPRLARLTRPLRICSAATSIGCEAYSLAMVIDDFSRTVHPVSFEIDAFDLNPEAIETAREGRYTGNSLRDDGARWKFLLDRYTRMEGQNFVIEPGLREKVRFYTHNLLTGLMGNRYDLILFRNALIYFSADKRMLVLDHLVDALYDGGFLIFGVSETPAVSHPLLASRYNMDTFYFQKVQEGIQTAPHIKAPAVDRPVSSSLSPAVPHTTASSTGIPRNILQQKTEKVLKSRKKPVISQAEPEGIAALTDDNEGGHPIAEKVPELLGETADGTDTLSGNDLFAAVIYLLGQEEFTQADKLLSFIEKYPDHQSGSSAFTSFLRGEFHYFNNRRKDAESSYKEAASKNETFWPAFYRLSSLAAEGNPVQYAYKTRKALESIDRGRDQRFEVFIGGFSPDYYRQTLEKRLG